MSQQTEQPTREQVSAFGDKLIAFTRTLTTRERELFTAMMNSAHQSLGSDVAGYDADETLSDLSVSIKWEVLTDISINPPPETQPGTIDA